MDGLASDATPPRRRLSIGLSAAIARRDPSPHGTIERDRLRSRKPQPVLVAAARRADRRRPRRRRLPDALAARARELAAPRRGRARVAAVLLRGLAARGNARARLARGRARRSAVLHAHDPAHAAAGHRADPRDPRLHEGDPAPGHPDRARSRAPRRPARAPGVRGAAVRRGDLDLARARAPTTSRSPTRPCTCSSTRPS